MSKSPISTWFQRGWALPAIVLLGIAIAVLLVKTQPEMVHQEPAREGKPVRVLTVTTHNVRPRISGFGEASPDVLLDSRAEVSGKVVYVHPQLRKGAVLPRDTLAVRIDDQDYRLALKQAEATLTQSQASLAEQELALEDARINLKLAEDKLQIAGKELARNAALLEKGSISRSQYENQQSAELQLRQEVQNLKNQVNTLPIQIQVQQAQIAKSEAELATQQRNLERTEIRLPYTARITALNTEENLFVSQGASLFSAQTIDKMQVDARFSLEHFRILASGFGEISIDADTITIDGQQQPSDFFERLGLSASIRLVGDIGSQWPGQVEQISNNLDPASRTLGVTIGVDDPYKNIVPGVRPPLVEGMYTEVSLQGRAVPYLVIPRQAMHEGEVYLVDADSRLRRVPVRGYPQDEMLLVTGGFSGGQRIVTSDLFPAVEGMLLTPIEDPAAEQQLKDWLEAH